MNFSVTNSSDERRFLLAVLDNKQLSVTWKKACFLSVGNGMISLVSVSSYSSVHIFLKCYKLTTFAISGNSFMLRLIWVSTRKKKIKLALTPQKCFWSCISFKVYMT